VTSVRKEAHCTPVASTRPDTRVFDCVTHALDGDDPDTRTRQFASPAGQGYLGNDYFGEWREYDPPLLALPNDVHPGARWEANFRFGLETKHRELSCEAYGGCPNGITIVGRLEATTKALIVTREHYCEGIGLVASEVTVTRADGSVSRSVVDRYEAMP
jgi:hypothetical protein